MCGRHYLPKRKTVYGAVAAISAQVINIGFFVAN